MSLTLSPGMHSQSYLFTGRLLDFRVISLVFVAKLFTLEAPNVAGMLTTRPVVSSKLCI